MEYLLPARINAWLAVLAGAALISLAPAHADVLVLKSNVPGIDKKSVLQDDAILDVPEKKSVKVILKPSNVTKVIKGPYKGTANDYVPSAVPSIATKPQVEFDTGTTANAPPPRSNNNLILVDPE